MQRLPTTYDFRLEWDWFYHSCSCSLSNTRLALVVRTKFSQVCQKTGYSSGNRIPERNSPPQGVPLPLSIQRKSRCSWVGLRAAFIASSPHVVVFLPWLLLYSWEVTRRSFGGRAQRDRCMTPPPPQKKTLQSEPANVANYNCGDHKVIIRTHPTNTSFIIRRGRNFSTEENKRAYRTSLPIQFEFPVSITLSFTKLFKASVFNARNP